MQADAMVWGPEAEDEGGARAQELAAELTPRERARAFFGRFDAARWVWFGAWVFFVATFCVTMKGFVQTLLNGGDAWTEVDKFTNQSNWLLLVYASFYVWFPRHRFLRGGRFLVSACVYIFFTFVGYNAILTAMGTGWAPGDDAWGYASNAFVHLLAPLLFIGCALAQMWLRPIKAGAYARTALPGMAYPTVYVAYAASIPWVMHDPNAFNQSGPGVTPVYSVYNDATDTLNHPSLAWPIIVCVWLLFFPGSFAAFHWACRGLRVLAFRREAREAGDGLGL